MADLGEKHVCGECDTKYYDLGSGKAVCPQCGSPRRFEEEDVELPEDAAPEEPADEDDELEEFGDEELELDEEEFEEAEREEDDEEE